MTDGTLAANVTKVRLVHASVRQLHKKSGVWEYDKWGEPVSRKYTTGAACIFSTQILQGMRNLGRDVSKDDAEEFICAWHYVNHYLGMPEKWLLPRTRLRWRRCGTPSGAWSGRRASTASP
ncbi:oxygenase MpaB family protein [Streptomyces sp. NK15101]|uniref:oxygenase MpaB family protein n=1 Tax=Streptomyces sp. NK15101 TaxID=2873261 RepID=UPI001CEC387E|nr:oxygenase MpaB family protein [Streptomyces sp. NK15101]